MLRNQAKIAAVGAFALVLAAYVALAMTDANAQQSTPSPAASPMASPGASPVASPMASPVASPTVTMVDIAFQPPQLTIPANTSVTITLTNTGAAVHNFNIDELNVHSGDIQPGQQGSVTISAQPGTYTYYCNIPGHKEAGMVGQLTVK